MLLTARILLTIATLGYSKHLSHLIHADYSALGSIGVSFV
jgi:hypothetical protein